ncbi:MAG: 50S ribosomal protein L18 [Pseudomonadales bacterium]|nr:MAG: 50S ribosomal protein L18 [Pseudomonadales bacterium]
MFDKKSARLRRAKKTRAHIRGLGANRLVVHRTSKHMYAQLISPTGGEVLAQASTLDTALRSAKTGNIEAAAAVGALIAERAKAVGITKVAFDRSGFKYHGRAWRKLNKQTV